MKTYVKTLLIALLLIVSVTMLVWGVSELPYFNKSVPQFEFVARADATPVQEVKKEVKKEKELTPQEYREGYETFSQQAKELRWELYKSDMNMSVGRSWYDSVLREVRELRSENMKLKKQLQSARDYLERLPKPVYVSDITGKVYDDKESPLARETVSRRTVEEKLKQEKDDWALERAVLKAEASRIRGDLYTVAQERDKLQKQVEADRRYFKALKDRGIVE